MWQKKGLIWQGKRVNLDNDYAPCILQKRKEYAEVRRILKDRDIQFQTMYPARLKVSYRIDYFFIYNRDLHRIGQCDIGPIAPSDHGPINIPVCLNRKPRSTLWRLNSNILNNTEITEALKDEIRIYLELNDNGEVAPSMLWDALKAVMSGKIIATTSAIKKLKRQRLHDLEIRLKHLQRDHTFT